MDDREVRVKALALLYEDVRREVERHKGDRDVAQGARPAVPPDLSSSPHRSARNTISAMRGSASSTLPARPSQPQAALKRPAVFTTGPSLDTATAVFNRIAEN